jgi:arginine-tRNA-protein transferase
MPTQRPPAPAPSAPSEQAAPEALTRPAPGPAGPSAGAREELRRRLQGPAAPLIERVVQDEPEACAYREGQVARTPLRYQLRPLDGAAFDRSLAGGDRRVGRMLYRTACPSCRACEPLRIPVAEFWPTRSQRRVLQRNADVTVSTARSSFSEEKLALYNRHKQERGLARGDGALTRSGYEGWLVESCTETVEMVYRVDGRLIGVGVVDLGQRDASSVYFYFDPDEHRRSLGVFSVLMEIAWLKSMGGRHHYLGLYVADCRHLVYKGQYYPHERLHGGRWWKYTEGGADPAELIEEEP